MSDELDIRAHRDGATLILRVKPKAQADRLLGTHAGALKLSVRAAPERGRANDEVRRLLAKVLDLPLSAIEVVTGAASQDKTLLVRGLTPEELRSRLDRALDR